MEPYGSPANIPNVNVFLRLLTPNRETKLQALLASSQTQPPIALGSSNTLEIARAILRYPLALLLTMPRILYQAYLLHYEKQLLVYPRPEPKVEGDQDLFNPSQMDERRIGVGIGWQSLGWAENRAKEMIEDWAERRTLLTGIQLEMVFLNQRTTFKTAARNGDPKSILTVTTADPKLFTHMLSALSVKHFLFIAPELQTTISSEDLFEEFFAPSLTSSRLIDRISHIIRDRHVRWFWARSHIPPTPELVAYPSKPIGPSLASVGVLIILQSYLADTIEESILNLLEAKFIPGQEPWKLWERALARQYRTFEANERSHEPDSGTQLVEETGELNSRVDDEDEGEGWVNLGSMRYDRLSKN